MTGPTLSACVIACDEQERLPDCLASLGFCDELILVDSGSTDDTVALAEAAGARVLRNPWPGFAAQRNVALEAARSEWALEVDADERIEPSLAAAIRRFLEDPDLTAAYDMAMLPMRHRFLGRELGAAMQAPGYRPRLFRRDRYRHDEGRIVHEGLWPQGPALPLDDGVMVHELAASWGEAVTDLRAYAALGRRQYTGAVTPRAALVGVAVRPAAKAGYRLMIDGGWRDGWAGAARIGLESLADAATWVGLALDGRRAGAAAGHVGSTEVHLGAVKVVGVAATPEDAAVAGRVLAELAEAGAETVLVAAGVPPAAPRGLATRGTAGAAIATRVRAPADRGRLGLARALDAEHQVRPVDGLVVAGRRAAVSVHPARAARHPRVQPGEAPGDAVVRLRAARPGVVSS